jgi:hypothetical protein
MINRGTVRSKVQARVLVGLLLVGALLAPAAAGAATDDGPRPGSGPDAAGGADNIGANAPLNDDFAAAQVLAPGNGQLQGHNVDATVEDDEPDPVDSDAEGTVWYSWTAPSDGEATFTTLSTELNFGPDTVLAAYTGTSLDTLVDVVENDDIDPGTHDAEISFAATSGTVYRIQLAGYGDSEGSFRLTWNGAGFGAGNDAFAHMLPVYGYDGDVAGTTLDATHEVGEATHGNAANHASVWYTWLAPTNGTVTFTADGLGDTDTTLSAYNMAGTIENLGPSFGFGDDEDGVDASITFATNAGFSYRIVVDAKEEADEGDFVLAWESDSAVPSNDDFADAEVLSGDFNTAGFTYEATSETGEPSHHAGAPDGRSVWFTWTPTTTGPVSLSTDDSDFDSVLAVYLGESLTDLQLVAWGDQAYGTDQAVTRFVAHAGETLTIALTGWDGDGGHYVLDHEPVDPTFSDVSASNPFFHEVEWMEIVQISTGYEDGTYRPSAPVSRQAMSAFLHRLVGSPTVPPNFPQLFPDVSPSHPFFEAISFMAVAEITGGYPDGTFRGGAPVTRQAMSAFMYRLAADPGYEPPGSASFSDVSTSHPFFDEVEWMADTEITTGYADGTFRPGATVSRQAMSAFMYRLIRGPA